MCECIYGNAGDPRQLSPVVRSMQAKAMGLGTSLLEVLTKQQQQRGGDVGSRYQEMVMLTRNYRYIRYTILHGLALFLARTLD